MTVPDPRTHPAEFLDGVPDYWTLMLEALPTLAEGHSADLKVESYADNAGTPILVRVWLSRCSTDDGEPFESTVYVEHRDVPHGVWTDDGYFDGYEPDPTPAGLLGLAYELTRRQFAYQP